MEETPLDLGSQSLLGYLPAMVIKKIIDDTKDLSKNLPYHYLIKTVSLFADISGFTKLSESFAKLGRIGPEFLAFSLNRYMEKLINIIGKNGGDIFKFAGDALLVIWPEGSSIQDSCKRAIQCALDIQAELHNVEISKDKKLSIKIGIGVGEVRILFVGGQFDRAEYLIVGEAMRVACLCETKATNGGQTIVHESVHNLISAFYSYDEIPEEEEDHGYDTKGMKFYMVKHLIQERIPVRADAYLMRTKFNANKVRSKLPLLKSFVPKAISIYLDLEKERWSKEIRMLTIMFLNLKVDLSQTNNEEGIKRIQKIVKAVQRCIYLTKGALNKFLMDDKGSVMLIVWGLPPFSEITDASRAVYTALELVKELPKYNCGAYMGITTGSCFTGVCGTIGGRREYSLLGEVVNLSARHMQQAILVGKQKKTSYEILLCEKTKILIQNDIACEWVCEGMLKGFTQTFQFYKPIPLILPVYTNKKEVFLPLLRTHRNNFYLGDVNENEKKNEVPLSLNKSIFMVSRKVSLESFKKDLLSIYKYKSKELMLIRGVYGSGKTLFVRKAFYEILEGNRDLKNRYFANRSDTNLDFIFISSQNARSHNIPFNGFNSIFKQILSNLREFTQLITRKRKIVHAMGDEKIELNCDLLGEILFETNCYSYQRYIEEILEISFQDHFSVVSQHNEIFNKVFKIVSIPELDLYFSRRDFLNFGKTIIKFFVALLKHYKQLIGIPMFIIAEDCQLIDYLSVEFIRELSQDEKLDSLGVICTLQDPICNVQKEGTLFAKILEEFKSEQIYVMDNISDFDDVNKLIINDLSQINLTLASIQSDLLDIILKKSYKGNPLFILDIVDSILSKDLAYIDEKKKLVPREQLLHMEADRNYSNFPVPIRIEKYVGHLLDCYSTTKEIITLKLAAVIGNLFSVDTLHSLNEFNSLTFEDILSILYNFENKGILDVLYDLNVHQSVFMFVIPFCREVLYQRMLIEQKNDLHLNIARNMQKSKFSYMPSRQELASLNLHLKLSEKSLIDYIKEDGTNDAKGNQLNINNLKLYVIKEVTQNIKSIENHLDHKNKNMIQCVKYGDVYKKGDKKISWEKRYVAISQNRMFYWYDRSDHETNKVPLGFIELKHLYQVEVLPDSYFGNRSNLFQIHVAQWYKKDILQGPRKYIFSCDDREGLYSWVISLNFMRVKALHDEFSVNFGSVSMPLFAVEKEEKRFEKNIKKKFVRINPEENKKKAYNGVSCIYNNIVRKSVSVVSSSSTNITSNNRSTNRYSEQQQLTLSKSASNSIMRRISQVSSKANNSEFDGEELEKTLKLRQQFDLLWKYSFINFHCYLQDIIFNIDGTGLDDDLISIPSHIEELRELPMIDKSDPFFLNLLKKKDKHNQQQLVVINSHRESLSTANGVDNNNDSKDSKESLGNNNTSPYLHIKNQNEDENQQSTQQKNTLPTPKKKESTILKNNTDAYKIKITNTNTNNNQLIGKENTNNFISEEKNQQTSNHTNNTGKGNAKNNINNSSKFSGCNEDEEKTEANMKYDNKMVSGTISVGKNLAEFDMDLHDEGINDIENFFNNQKKKKGDKISFIENSFSAKEKPDY